MLSGVNRVRLFRLLHDSPGQHVTQLAADIGVGVSNASQELRRIQSRGLLSSRRQGLYLIYELKADPQVSSAAPLLRALQTAMKNKPPKEDRQIVDISIGLAHARRIALVRAFMDGCGTLAEVTAAARIPTGSVSHHMLFLRESGWVGGKSHYPTLTVPDHPLARAYVRLIEDRTTR